MIKIIAAISNNRVLGNENKLLWSLPNDLKRFRQLTINNTVVMGRKTYESIGKPLSNRRNIIVTRNCDYKVNGCEVVNSIEEALYLCGSDCFIIGGSEIYKQTISISSKIYLTLVDCEFEGDAYFPEITDDWYKVSKIERKEDENHEYKYSFVDYERYKF
jgi:dihydrofolate reductase